VCGIFGIVYRRSSAVPPEEKLVASRTSLHHRGPDGHGIYAAEGIGFAHTRLSFLDVDSRSNQPFWDATGRYCLLFNGEIYNFRELRHGLEARGVQFRTTSDTEVLLQALINGEPEAVLRDLKGMFGFALYDRLDRTLLLARDRFGMKPLYVYEDGDVFMFTSEIKALRPWVSLALDQFSISSYLLKFGGPTQGFTFYQGLKSVPPGGVVRYSGSGPSTQGRYTRLPDFWNRESQQSLAAMSTGAVVDQMDALLSESVNKHMFADVPVGAFCSGGVDSSLLMAMAAKQYNNLAIFHANVKGQWSEHHAAAALSKHLRLDLQSVDVVEQDFVDMLPKVMTHYEHPFTYHPNCAPLMMVAQLARDNGVKGLLSGEGSDECFLGYPWLGRQRIMNAYYGAGRRVRSMVRSIPGVGQLLWPDSGTTSDVVRTLLNRGEIFDDEQYTRNRAAELGDAGRSPHAVWTLDYLHYHLRTLLHRNDSMGMAASIEARFPFLDHAVVEMAVNLPARYKLRVSPLVFEKAHPWIRDKWIVRKVADRYIPKGLSQRIKIGFWTTVFQRMQVAPAYFDGGFVPALFGLSQPQMRALVERADQDLIMRLLHLEVWGRVCAERQPVDASVARLRDHVTIRPE
jgi:asparagine synthase (glutamine-hydrolysing)